MPERGAQVPMPKLARLVFRGLEYFSWPLRLDDYLGLISPLWSTEELRGRIDRVQKVSDGAVTAYITPGFRWRGHDAGQYVRIGFDIAGKRQWRAYSLSSDAARPDGQITITVKRTDDGVVSQFLNSPNATGAIVSLGEVEGEFVLPAAAPDKLLFITAGSGITPVMAMLSSLHRKNTVPDTVHLHSARKKSEAIFADELDRLEREHDGYRIVQRVTSDDGRIAPDDLDSLVPDWRERETYACGPGEMLDGLKAYYEEHDVSDRFHMESFEHFLLGGVGGEGGTIEFTKSGITADCDGETPILVAGEDAGAALPYGCRMGICHTCTGTLLEGAVRDLRTGDVTKAGTEIRTCVNCPDGAIKIQL